MRNIIALFLILVSITARSENVGWRNADGSPAPNTDSMKSIDGFGGWLLVTPDADWEQKWNTPSENVPHFNEAHDVSYGQELTILIFFTNPKPNEQGLMNITCDIKVQRPDGSLSINADNVPCAVGWQMPPNPYSLLLTQAVIKYVGESDDLPGEWKVSVNLVDQNSGIMVPLKTKFNLIEEVANKSSKRDAVNGAPS
ncbi:hypothetical protein [Microbulbifer sp. JMSA003]|uniref:hypothetical protein n=1 Tax=Microbulbifer sp. JMSA003 TaxID=3243369 RepID=UPI00403A2972